MKKYILLIALLLTSLVYAQKPKAETIRYTGVTTTERDALSPPATEYWFIYNTTTTQWEYWDGDSWEVFTGGGGATQLSDLTDVVSATNTNRYVLVANGTTGFVSRQLTEADISDLGTYLTTETNDLSSAVTWTTIPDAFISQTSVTQHQGALTITESQISDLNHTVNTDNQTLSFTSPNLSISGGNSVDISAINTDTQLSQEQVEDFAGALFTGNSETLITSTYNDGTGKVDLTVDNDLANYDNSTSNFSTGAHTVDTQRDIATSAEVNTGTDNVKAISPLALAGSQLQTDVTANNAKVSNATHTGDVTGSTALTIDPTAISGKALVTAVTGDQVLLWDATDSSLKKADVSDFGGGGGLNNIVEDVTPQLGGALDTQSNNITSPSWMRFIVGANSDFQVYDTSIGGGNSVFKAQKSATASSGSVLNAGDQDDSRGYIIANGDGTDYGGLLRLDNSVNEDATTNFWVLEADSNFKILNVSTSAFEIDDSTSGLIAPNMSIADINSLGNTALITKEYGDANYLGGGGLSNVVEDTTPQLGGNLDTNGHNITRTGNLNIDISGILNVGNISGALGYTIYNSSITSFGSSLHNQSNTSIINYIDHDNNGSVESFEIRANSGLNTVFKAHENGTLSAAEMSNAEIDTQGATALITKGYADANYGGGSGDDVSTFAEKTGDLVGTDRLVGLSGATDFSETISNIPLSIFNNDAGFLDTTDYNNAVNRANHTGTQTASTISDFDTEVANNSAVTANTAKVSNATHTGDVTGSTALTIDPTAISGKTLVTAVTGDQVLLWDATDSSLKKADVSDFGGGGVSFGTDNQIPVMNAGGTDFEYNSKFRYIENIRTLIIGDDSGEASLSFGTGSLDYSQFNGDLTYNDDFAASSITATSGLKITGYSIQSSANNNINIAPNGTGNILLGNYTLDGDQTVGAGQDNYVLKYDNGTGLISLEAETAGGATNITTTHNATTVVVESDTGTNGTINLANGTTAGVSENNLTDSEKTVLGNTSGTNTGDQTSIVGITGTAAQFDTAVTDDNFAYQSDLHTKASLSKSITIKDPTAETITLWKTPVAITVTSTESLIAGSTNIVYNIGHASTRIGTQLDVFTSDITETSTAGATHNTGFNDATIPANSWVWLEIVSISGTPTEGHITLNYTED